MCISKKLTRKLCWALTVVLLVTQLFPVHFHLHNHQDASSDAHTGVEVQFKLLEFYTLEHHDHASVVSFNDNAVSSYKGKGDYLELAILISLFIVLVVSVIRSMKRRLLVKFYPPDTSYQLKPFLRAPPILFS